MKKQIKSFLYAFKGIAYALRTEAHLRFHIVAAVFVLIFAVIGGLSRGRIALLLVLIGAVIALEIVNTAIERLCDAVTEEQNPRIKAAKDCAAAAVLVMAVSAAAVAVIFFLNGETLSNVFGFFSANPFAILPLTVLAAASVVFILFCGRKKY